MRGCRRCGAFSLIEGLCLLAILALFVVIAAPNFQHARTRARLSKVQADMNFIAKALEAYRAELDTYPQPSFWKDIDPGGPGDTFDYRRYNAWRSLTTPVAYVTGDIPDDPFRSYVLPTHTTYRTSYDIGFGSSEPDSWGLAPSIRDLDNAWIQGNPIRRDFFIIQSHGPDGSDRTDLGSTRINRGPDGFSVSGSHRAYDPTNGLLSAGDIYRIGGSAAVAESFGQ